MHKTNMLNETNFAIELEDLQAEHVRELMLDRICNTFERVSEQLTALHAQLNSTDIVKESEAVHA